MIPIRSRVLCFAVSIFGVVAVPGIGVAQTYPNRPLRIIVPFPPGGAPDIVARILGNKLTEQFGQQVIVDQRPGASGIIGVQIAKTAAPDGYTLLLVGTTLFSTLPALRRQLSYDPDADFIALSRVASAAYVVAVHPSVGVGSVADLVKLARARPGQLNYGSGGNGTTGHIGGEMFDVLAGTKTVHVPYRGVVLALNDLIAGQLQFIVASPLLLMPHANAGRIKVIATTGARRDRLLPELPPAADILPGFEITGWQGVALPAKTPSAIVKKLHAAIVQAMQTPEARELLARQGATAHAESPGEFSAFLKAERGRIGRVGRQAGITVD